MKIKKIFKKCIVFILLLLMIVLLGSLWVYEFMTFHGLACLFIGSLAIVFLTKCCNKELINYQFKRQEGLMEKDHRFQENQTRKKEFESRNHPFKLQ